MRYTEYRQGNKQCKTVRTFMELVGIGAGVGLLGVVAARVWYDFFPDIVQEEVPSELCCPYCTSPNTQTTETLSLEHIVFEPDFLEFETSFE